LIEPAMIIAKANPCRAIKISVYFPDYYYFRSLNFERLKAENGIQL